MKFCYIDIETTGTKFWRNGIHQISGAIEIDEEIKEDFNFKVKPYHAAEIEDEALKCSNITREIIATYSEMKDVHKSICDMLGKYVEKYDRTDKFFLVGYNNASFDNHFFRAFFVQCKDDYFGSWFWSSSIDVMVLAADYLKSVRATMKDFQLKTVARKLGIEVDETKLHDAVYDIYLTRQIYKIVQTSVLTP